MDRRAAAANKRHPTTGSGPRERTRPGRLGWHAARESDRPSAEHQTVSATAAAGLGASGRAVITEHAVTSARYLRTEAGAPAVHSGFSTGVTEPLTTAERRSVEI